MASSVPLFWRHFVACIIMTLDWVGNIRPGIPTVGSMVAPYLSQWLGQCDLISSACLRSDCMLPEPRLMIMKHNEIQPSRLVSLPWAILQYSSMPTGRQSNISHTSTASVPS